MQMASSETWVKKLGSWLGQWRSLGVGLLFVAVLAGWAFLPVTDWIENLQSWIDDFGVLGPPIFILIYVLAVVLLVPGSALTIAAGLAYGNWGIPLALFASTAGASCAFLIARYIAYKKVHTLLAGKEVLQAVESVVNNEGWKIIVLVRISPLIPFNIQNYFFGVTEVPLWQYIGSTFVGLIPGTIVNVVIAKFADGGFDGGVVQWGFLSVGMTASCFLVWHVTRKVKTKLANKPDA
jgi:uncharacterized membrane protein YdjX (TVP38/TMEM64 family)